MSYRKKLIEVALPLIAINKAAATEKSIRHGHPSTLHLWWARRPLATCRAILFASLIDDPSEHPDQFKTEEARDSERKRLFNLLERFVDWKNVQNEELLKQVKAEIDKATNGNPPPVLDPFAGGGSIPLEAQRLGLEAHASDLNPVAVLINKALIEIPSRFANRPPVNPDERPLLANQKNEWKGAHGLANDIRYYGKWMRDEAEKRIGHLYPKVTLPEEYGKADATVVAWIWARTVRCSNPACSAQTPLVSSFWLSKKTGNKTWIEYSIDHTVAPATVNFQIKHGSGTPPISPKLGRGANFKCVVCESIINEKYIKSEFLAHRADAKLMAIIAEGKKGRVYLPPLYEQEAIALSAKPEWIPEQEMPKNARWFSPPVYGMPSYGDIFTSRQLVALTTFSNLVQEVRERVLTDAATAHLSDDARRLHDDGSGALAYADAIAVYLAIAVDRLASRNSSICSWDITRDSIRQTFARQAIPMVWDFAEANPMSESTGNFQGNVDSVSEVIEDISCETTGFVNQRDATASVNGVAQPMISTDPPYYDNIGYADLSDFFYVWLRRSLSGLYPDLFRTMLVPKKQELVATPYRFEGNKRKAQEFFEHGLGEAFERMRTAQHADYPLTIYYAFKQAESEIEQEDISEEEDIRGKKSKNMAMIASTGWETMLEGLIRAGFTINGTWPVRTEMMNRSISHGTNALASSIVLVCRPRSTDAQVATRREFLRALKEELPEALHKLQHANIAAVDLEQALLGPGMAIYSRYSKVVEADGTPLKVRAALQFINQMRSEIEGEEDSTYDAGTQWAIKWFEWFGWNAGPYGDAETLSKSKNMSVANLEHAGLVIAKAGKVHLQERGELPAKGDLGGRKDLTTWEVMQRMIQELLHGNTEVGAAHILRQTSEHADMIQTLAYRLFTLCERKKMALEAMPYNSLVTSWPEITRLAYRENEAEPKQTTLF